MVVMESKAKKWGNSIGFIIPKDALDDIDVHEGEIIQVDIKTKKKLDGFGLFRKAKPFRESEEHPF